MRTTNSTSETGRAGFTLVEILIAMLILAIGIMATLSMQFTALGGAAEARDNTNASQIGKRVLHVMRTEAQAWRNGTISADLASQPAYKDVKFENTPLLQNTVGNNWAWTRVFSEPVDVRLSDSGNRRYCAYTRGGYMEGNAASGVAKLQIAVVYPGANETFPDGECFATGDSIISDQLDPSLAAEDSIQIEGFRANYFGGVITRRGYLP
ncbi:MAG: type IV pilus modification PilV family protein [Myxococcota bacterium]